MTQTQLHPLVLVHPDRDDFEVLAVLRALGDPTRFEIVRILSSDPAGERACGSFGLEATKQNLTHHFRVLREAGITRTRDEGRNRFTSLRRDDLDARFPGLLDAILDATPPPESASRPNQAL